MNKRHFFRTGLALAVAGAAGWGHAQPAGRPMTLVVPYPAGGPLDTAARVLGEKVQAATGNPMIVENRPGAGGNVGVAHAAKAAPDGNTLVMGAVATHAINPWLFPSIPYDALKDFAPITLVSRVPNVLVMTPETAARLGVKTVRDLVDYTRKNPGRLSYASGGNGSAGHLSGELFKSLAKVSMVHIPYLGAAPALTAVLGGQMELMFDNLASAAPHIKSGKLLALGVTTINRSPVLPEVPSLNDTLPGFHLSTWFGLFAPAQTPPATVARLNELFTAALRHPDTAARFARMGAEPTPLSSADFAAMVRKEHADYGRLIKAAQIKLE